MIDDVRLTKFAVARRQIDSSIQMYFSDHDKLAIYSTIGAAIKLLSEIGRSRGSDRLIEIFQISTAIAIHDYLNGREVPQSHEQLTKDLISELDASTLAVLRSSSVRTMANNEIVGLLPVDREWRRLLWRGFLYPFNFLKHATHDMEDTVNEDELSAEGVIFVAMDLYVELGLEPSEPMRVFNWYHGVRHNRRAKNAEPLVKKILQALRGMSDQERKSACRELIAILEQKMEK